MLPVNCQKGHRRVELDVLHPVNTFSTRFYWMKIHQICKLTQTHLRVHCWINLRHFLCCCFFGLVTVSSRPGFVLHGFVSFKWAVCARRHMWYVSIFVLQKSDEEKSQQFYNFVKQKQRERERQKIECETQNRDLYFNFLLRSLPLRCHYVTQSPWCRVLLNGAHGFALLLFSVSFGIFRFFTRSPLNVVARCPSSPIVVI